ncbi:MerR family transcriptional regulator [Secundilactobacillus collinoides]|uniref:MerR family transcriptional regulator n=1 Tax=Secundilactobacillus collinoides TaxID=33960 RepID=UPI0006D1C78C|nr:MerR family transcriptional regulator [Secundilactobacillus collinoides]
MEDTFLTAGQFAAMLQIDRHELDRADERGLFVPVKRENNGHRWYALSQVNAWLILQSLQKLGVSEPEIKTMMSAPNDFSGLLHQQQRLINKHIERLTALQEQVSELITANETAQRAVADQVTIVNRAPQDMLVTKPTADAASETALIELICRN